MCTSNNREIKRNDYKRKLHRDQEENEKDNESILDYVKRPIKRELMKQQIG